MKTADRQLHIICALRRACNKSFFFMHFMCTVYTLLKKDFSHKKKTTWNHKSLSHRLTSFYHYHFYDFKFKQTEFDKDKKKFRIQKQRNLCLICFDERFETTLLDDSVLSQLCSCFQA